MPKNLSQIAKQKKIKYFLISFVDLFGVLRSKLVPAQAIAEMQKNGAGFAGFATWLDMTPADSDMFGVPEAGLDYEMMEEAKKDEKAVSSATR